MNNTMKLGIAALACVSIGYTVGRFTGPAKIETKEVERVVYRDRIVQDEKKNVETHTKETQLPDGTKVTETVTKDKSAIHSDTSRELEHDKLMETKTSQRPDWRIGAVYYPPLLGYQGETYGAMVERRLFSEVYVGVVGTSDTRIGVVGTIGF